MSSPAQRLKARRQQRWRQRQRRCEVVVPVPVTLEVIGVLLDLHWLTIGDSENRARIGNAVSRLLDDLATGRGTNKT